jgi:hypothetical protein
MIRANDHIKDKLASVLERTGNVSAACTAAGISRTTYYNLVQRDPEFAMRIRLAHENFRKGIEVYD